MYDIYYAHHQWKYNSEEERYELDLIRNFFPLARIFNPAVDLKTPHKEYKSKEDCEKAVMEECLSTVKNSDILIFSSLDGCIGTGVYQEVMEALSLGKIIFYIYQDNLHTAFKVRDREDTNRTDRLYAYIDI